MKFVFGGTGMLGRALVRELMHDVMVDAFKTRRKSHQETSSSSTVIAISSKDVDLTDQARVREFFRSRAKIGPSDEVYHCAGLVGGIGANRSRQMDFLVQNSQMALNVISAAIDFGVERLYYVSSSCVYPRQSAGSAPMTEDEIGRGAFEPTNEGYAIAKFLGGKLCEYATEKNPGARYLTVVPCNLYGDGDNFTEGGHVLASIVRRVVDARRFGSKSVTLWGDGTPRREFLHVRDAAAAINHVASKWSSDRLSTINVGSDEDYTIREIAELVARVAEWDGKFEFDDSMPNGTPKKLMDSSAIRSTGWKPTIDLERGVRMLVNEYERVAK